MRIEPSQLPGVMLVEIEPHADQRGLFARTFDAAAFGEALATDARSPVTYTSPKPDAILEEDKAIATFPLKIKRENIRILPVTELFAK